MKTGKGIALALLVAAAAAGWTAGCTSGTDTKDARTDVRVDPVTDTTADTTTDPTIDPTTDTRPDPTIDPTTDTRPDPTIDPTTDTRPDLTTDIVPDGGSCTTTIATMTCTEQECTYATEGTDEAWVYTGYYQGGSTTEPASFLGIELWPGFGGPSAPGTFSFTDANYADCGLCGLVGENCTTGSGCAKLYLITSGSTTLTQVGDPGGTFAGSATSLRGIEVDIDGTTYESTPVPGGAVLCIGAVSFTATVVAYSGG